MEISKGQYQRIVISEQYLQTFGASSLVGSLLNQSKDGKIAEHVILIFPISSEESQRVYGSKRFKISEKIFPELLKDVLWLKFQGVNLEIEEQIQS